MYRPRVRYASEAEYREHFQRVYCKPQVITTFDGIEVRFEPNQFDHAFYEGDIRRSRLSRERAERIDWIGEALRDTKGGLYVGWDNARGIFNPKRRVCLVSANYVVVIQLTDTAKKKAVFVTAYVASSGTVRQIKQRAWTDWLLK